VLTAPVPTRVDPMTVALRMVCALIIAVGAVLNLGWVGRDADAEYLLDDAQNGRMSKVVVTSDDVFWRTDGAFQPWRAHLPLSYQGTTYGAHQVQHLLDRYAFPRSPRVEHRGSPLPSKVGAAVVLASLAGFLLLVAGPAPWRANRWAWFWFLWPGRGASIGLLLFLLLSGPTPGIPAPRPHAERWSGAKGFGYSLLLGFVLSVVWWKLTDVFWPARTGAVSLVTPPRA
jgi:hypothetical protein